MPLLVNPPLRLASVLFCTICTVLGDDFRYYVFDETKTDKLHYVHVHDFTVHDFAEPSPRLVFNTGYRIYGCAQNSFTYITEECALDVPRKRFEKLITAIRKIPRQKLQPKEQHGEEAESSHGLLELDGTSHNINAPP